ncbi:hypothetical protein QQM39_42705 [Streptomyces sp. DT2A-34]|uniref:hypothetical protein n=1 Tax=Streptomyces sp. DT2A-34 TaxID=3051182 RepID=UPI00265B80A2|nr:hypothetical protein [Streptomyces sp. DT2A-34]MDO0917281.1 hypothetical protein [Streptomyces sp. DT2A-34]
MKDTREFRVAVAQTWAELARRGVTIEPATLEDAVEHDIRQEADRLGIQVRAAWKHFNAAGVADSLSPRWRTPTPAEDPLRQQAPEDRAGVAAERMRAWGRPGRTVKLTGAGAMVFLILAALFGLIRAANEPGPSPYAVAFDDSVDCDDPPDLILSIDTGEPMVCVVSPVSVYVEDPDFGVFTEDDVDGITATSKWLAQDGHLSAADKQVIERKAEAIGARHGYQHPKPRDTWTGTIAIICLIGASISGLLYWLWALEYIGVPSWRLRSHLIWLTR